MIEWLGGQASSQDQATTICYQGTGIAAFIQPPSPQKEGSSLLYHKMQVNDHSDTEEPIAKLVF